MLVKLTLLCDPAIVNLVLSLCRSSMPIMPHADKQGVDISFTVYFCVSLYG